MRKIIMENLSELYNEEEKNIREVIKLYKIPEKYKLINVKSRLVVEKGEISNNNNITLDYFKELLNRLYNIRFPNRSFIMKELMNIIPYLNKYHQYTIIKIDFEKFFYNVNVGEIKKILINDGLLYEKELNFLVKYLNKNRILYPGVGIHNTLLEILGDKFNKKVRETFKDDGLIFFARYVDDSILIFDQHLDDQDVMDKLKQITSKVLGKDIKINQNKSKVIKSTDGIEKFEYLGYLFEKRQNGKYCIGIASSKLKKYKIKLEKIVLEYKGDNNLEKMCLKLEILYKRTVYWGNTRKIKYKRWQVRGLSDSYKELRRFMTNLEDFSKITKETENFFVKDLETIFKKNSLNIPPEIESKIANKSYSAAFFNNRAIMLNKTIGLSQKDLVKRLDTLGVSVKNGTSYEELALSFLKKIP
ncbi:reverse transcriptase domain-containing protein [Psychrobacillus sp. FSL H8-0483]|uniref:reverse transcriptase domain-containing protein n=1 Tax=Psychrobacillus sp. FSL H8-0483 TaxID=2921389 RepID=UPI00315A8A07